MFGLDTHHEIGGSDSGVVTSVTIKPAAAKRGTLSARASRECWTRWKRPEDWPAFLSVQEAAAYLRVSQDVVRDALHLARDRRARLAHHRIGRRIIIRRADLDAFSYVEGRAIA